MTKTAIQEIHAQEILDSRGQPTLEVEVILENNLKACASVPAGTSRGKYEARELRDEDLSRYQGKGVLKACENVNTTIFKALKGEDVRKQPEIDRKMIELDGTRNKSRLGANAILGVSLACARAGAKAEGVELYEYLHSIFPAEQDLASRDNFPLPMMVMIEGGKHGKNSTDLQEFMIVPRGASSFKDALERGREVYHSLGKILAGKGYSIKIGLEGAYTPFTDSPVFPAASPSPLTGSPSPLTRASAGVRGLQPTQIRGPQPTQIRGPQPPRGRSEETEGRNQEALELIMEAIRKAGYRPGKEISLALDAAASEFYDKRAKKYILKSENLCLSRGELIEIYQEWVKKYPVFSIEDGLVEDDWEGWKKLNPKWPLRGVAFGDNKIQNSKLLIVGDDLFTTNLKRLQRGIREKAANAILIKPNQVGTLTETIECIKLAQENNFEIIISHRSGETLDTFITDLAVATAASFLKAGAPSQKERMVKYERLVEIESRFMI